MGKLRRDPGLDELLEFNGTVLVADPIGQHWVKFVVHRVESTPERPHGLSYSLTLHAADGERLVGFDNAHAVARKQGMVRVTETMHDHKHRFRAIKPYEYQDAATLLADFWDEVDNVLKERGVIP